MRDEVWCFFSGLQQHEIEFLWKTFGVYVDGYRFMPNFKMGRWDGKIRFFEKTGKTYYRLLDKILPYVEGWGYEIDIVDNRVAVNAPTEVANAEMFSHREIGGKPFLFRPYQVECINAAIDAGSGFCLAGTGAGKCVSGCTTINIKCAPELKEAIENVRKKNLSHLQNR